MITSYYWHVLLLYNANHAFLYQQSILYEKHERDRINPALIIRNGFDLKTGKDFSINAGCLFKVNKKLVLLVLFSFIFGTSFLLIVDEKA